MCFDTIRRTASSPPALGNVAFLVSDASKALDRAREYRDRGRAASAARSPSRINASRRARKRTPISGTMLDNAANFKDDLKAHAERYTAEELRIIRAHEPLTPELTAKLVDGIMYFAQGFFEASPDHPRLPPANEVPYSFIFRFALCAYLHTLHWIYASGVNDRPLEKFRNDMIDVAIVAYATCFDGMFTNDKMATGVYKNANYTRLQRP
jgi:hypothetical protein